MADQPIQKFDPNLYVEAIRGKIRSAILDVVPEDEWDRIVKAEIEAFFRGKPEVKSGYYTEQRAVPAVFSETCNKIIREECEKRIRAMLDTPEWSGHWEDGQQVAGVKIQDFMRKNAGAIINSWLSDQFQMLLSTLRQQMMVR